MVYAGCQWGMLVSLAKIGSAEMLGQFSLAFAITAPVILFANLQLGNILATDARRRYEFGHYLGLRLVTTALAFLAIGAITYVSGLRRQTALVVLAVGLAKSFESMSELLYGLLQQHERMDRTGKSSMIKGLTSLTLFGLVIALTGSLLGGVLGLALGWAVVLLGYDVPSAQMVLSSSSPRSGTETVVQQWTVPRPHWDFHQQLDIARLALPLGFVMLLITLNGNMGRYFVERYLGERNLGIFSAMAYPMVALAAFSTALAVSAAPRLSQLYAEGDLKRFRTLLVKLLGISALMALGGVLAALFGGREILSILYRPEYAERTDVFLLLMIASGIAAIATVLNYSMIATRRLRVQMPLYALISAILALSNFALVPSLGLRGAAIAQIIAMGVQAMGGLLVVLLALHRGPVVVIKPIENPKAGGVLLAN